MIRIILAVLLALSFSQAEAKFPGRSGTTYYVSSLVACSDSNAGTSTSAPWCTTSKVNGATFNPGDTILFNGTFSGTLNMYGVGAGGHFGGTSLNPVTISSYGSGATFTGTLNGNCFNIKDTGGLVFGNVTCLGTGNTNGALNVFGMGVYNDTAANFDFVYLHDIIMTKTTGGVDMEPQSSGFNGFTNISFVNFTISNIAGIAGGVGIFMCDCLHSNNYAFKNVYISGLNLANFPGDGVDMWNVQGGVLRNSYVHNSNSLTNSTSGVQTNNADWIILERNEVSFVAPALDSNDACGLDFDHGTSNSVAQYNWIHDNAGCGIAIFQGTGQAHYAVTARYNLTQNNATGPTNVPSEIILGAFGQNTQSAIFVYGNTFETALGAANAVSCYSFGASTVNALISNNICYTAVTGLPRIIDTTSGGQISNPTTAIFQGNDYFGGSNFRWNNITYTTVATWRAGATQETFRGADTSLASNPSLTSPNTGATCFASGTPAGPQPCPTGYKIQAGSPMLNAGQNIFNFTGTLPGNRDYYGNTVPAANGSYDVGANQRTQ